VSIDEIREAGEESGREEASDEYPCPTCSDEYRELVWRGRARAQGMYGLRGKLACLFAQCWAMGYEANCAIFSEEEEVSE